MQGFRLGECFRPAMCWSNILFFVASVGAVSAGHYTTTGLLLLTGCASVLFHYHQCGRGESTVLLRLDQAVAFAMACFLLFKSGQFVHTHAYTVVAIAVSFYCAGFLCLRRDCLSGYVVCHSLWHVVSGIASILFVLSLSDCGAVTRGSPIAALARRRRNLHRP